jgi:hypothetical protein
VDAPNLAGDALMDKTITTCVDELSALGFRLGGSRRMAQKYPEQVKIGEDTDYDLYCPNEPKFIDAMTERGFSEVDCKHHNYWDDMLIAIWKSDAHPNIEILVRKDVEKYTKAFEIIGADMYIDYLWKSSPKRDNNIADPIFCAGVKIFFNSLFRLVGFIGTPPAGAIDDLPF